MAPVQAPTRRSDLPAAPRRRHSDTRDGQGGQPQRESVPSWARRDRSASPDVSRLYAILVLLKEQSSHGYELAERLGSLGINARLGQSMYRLLHDIEDQGLATSAWDLSQSGGPPRRTYTITAAGEQFLIEATIELVRQRSALSAILDRYRELGETSQHRRDRITLVSEDTDRREALWTVLTAQGWTVDHVTSENELTSGSFPPPDAIVVDCDRPAAAVDIGQRLRSWPFDGPIVLCCPALDGRNATRAVTLALTQIARDDVSSLLEHFPNIRSVPVRESL